MPIVQIYMKKGQSAEAKNELKDYVVGSISKATGTDPVNIFIFLNETEDENITKPGPVMMVFWAGTPSRTPEAKKKIMAEVSIKMSEMFDISIDNVVVTFTDLPLTNVAVGGVARG